MEIDKSNEVEIQDEATNDEELQYEIKILNQERPLFEENYVKLGGSLQFLKWSEYHDGTGCYSPDWEAISKEGINSAKFDENTQERANTVFLCLLSWIECAKLKAIPSGYYLMPLQPDQEMLNEAEKEFEDCDIEDLQDRIVFSHQAMIQVFHQLK